MQDFIICTICRHKNKISKKLIGLIHSIKCENCGQWIVPVHYEKVYGIIRIGDIIINVFGACSFVTAYTLLKHLRWSVIFILIIAFILDLFTIILLRYVMITYIVIPKYNKLYEKGELVKKVEYEDE